MKPQRISAILLLIASIFTAAALYLIRMVQPPRILGMSPDFAAGLLIGMSLGMALIALSPLVLKRKP
jgi:hypothetical protein